MLTRKVSTIKITINDARNTIAARRSAVDPSEVGNFALEGFSKFAISLAPPGSHGFLPCFVAANLIAPSAGPAEKRRPLFNIILKREAFKSVIRKAVLISGGTHGGLLAGKSRPWPWPT
jgi:hypothetical protein